MRRQLFVVLFNRESGMHPADAYRAVSYTEQQINGVT